MSELDNAPFARIAVVGAGAMGTGIARGIAATGIPVDLVDLDWARVQRGIATIRLSLEADHDDRASEILSRIRPVDGWSGLSEAGLVVEAVFENLDLKRQVFRRLEAACHPDTVLATTTSSFRVARIARVLDRPSRAIGLHYFYPPAENRLVEVVPTERTPTSVRELVWAMQQRIGKTSILSADSPGFIVNRFFLPWLIEAVRLLEEQVADVATIDAVGKSVFGTARGPFEVMNRTGLPFAFEATRTLGQAFGPFYRPPVLLERQHERKEEWRLDGAPDSTRFEAVERRLLGAVFLAASQMADDEVGAIEDADIGARIGLGWASGPFELMNEVGVGRAAEMVLSLTERWQLEPPGALSTRAAEGRPYEFCRVRSEVRDRVATLTVHRPDSNNALDEQVVTQLADAFHGAASDPDVEGIVLAGSGSSFIGGVDVGFFLRQIERRDLDPILELTNAIHLLFSSIEHCHKPVLARVHGPALGGGLEIALACRFIVATPQARFGFPETGLGIYPGLGGTQRTARKIGVGLTKALVFTGERIDSFEAASIGLADAVVPHTRLDETIRAVIAGATLDPGPRRLDSDWAALARFFEHHAVEDIRTGRIDTEDRAVLVRAVEQLGTKSPMALRVAERLIDEGIERPLHEGLHMELEYVREVFGSHDAYEGLSAVGARVPEFEGR